RRRRWTPRRSRPPASRWPRRRRGGRHRSARRGPPPPPSAARVRWGHRPRDDAGSARQDSVTTRPQGYRRHPSGMAKAIGIEAARREVLARVRLLEAEEVGLGEALGRRLALDAVADGPFQPFDNSAMDGFAVRAEDVARASADSPVA